MRAVAEGVRENAECVAVALEDAVLVSVLRAVRVLVAVADAVADAVSVAVISAVAVDAGARSVSRASASSPWLLIQGRCARGGVRAQICCQIVICGFVAICV